VKSLSPGALVLWVNFEISLFPAKMGAKGFLAKMGNTQQPQMPTFQQILMLGIYEHVLHAQGTQEGTQTA